MARAPYMIVEMSNSGLGERLVVERVQGTASRADLSIGRYWGDEPVLGTPCAANPRTGSLPTAPPPPPVPPPPPPPPAEPSTVDPVFIFPEFGEFAEAEALTFAGAVPTLAGGNPSGPVTPEGPAAGPGGPIGGGGGTPTVPEFGGGTTPTNPMGGSGGMEDYKATSSGNTVEDGGIGGGIYGE
jgi:hypothetical protein